MSLFDTAKTEPTRKARPAGYVRLKLEDIVFECAVWPESKSESDSRNAFNDLALSDKEKLIGILQKNLKNMEIEISGLRDKHKGKSIFG